MDWRYEWWADMGDQSFDKRRWKMAPGYRGDDPGQERVDSLAGVAMPLPLGCHSSTDSLRANHSLARSSDSLLSRAHDMAVERDRDGFSCFMGKWDVRYEHPPANPRSGIDLILTDEGRQNVRDMRAPLLAALDSAAQKLPGDRWIVGQRVRMHVDHDQPSQALAATRECRAERWWCLALRGYVWYSLFDARRASAVFDSSLSVAPDSVACAWNDISVLLAPAAAQAFRSLSCIDLEREQFVDRLWWLADPLYLEAGNERRVEHYGRWMLVTLRIMTDSVDGIFDFRNRGGLNSRYEGNTAMGKTPIQDFIIRYGYPVTTRGCDQLVCIGGDYVGPPKVDNENQDLPTRAPVQRWRRFDTINTYIGTYAHYRWPGPQYHTVPSWAAVMDPLRATDTDWDLNPPFLDRENWDQGWWPPELYLRERGPLFRLPTQIAFLRRGATAILAAAAEWDTVSTFRQPPETAIFGMALSTGPRDTMRVVAGNIDGRRPPTMTSPVASVPALLGIEMIPTPEVTDGAASRTRFGVSPPKPLSALAPDEIALSDPILVRIGPDAPAPASLDAALDDMLGTTELSNPQRMAVAWELYGAADGDTLDLSLRLSRTDDAGALRRVFAAAGIVRPGADSVVISWIERGAEGAPATIDAGRTIRFRSIAVGVGHLSAGKYTLEILTARRGATAAVARREFSIER